MPGYPKTHLIVGIVTNDRKNRFADGRCFNTSAIVIPLEEIVECGRRNPQHPIPARRRTRTQLNERQAARGEPVQRSRISIEGFLFMAAKLHESFAIHPGPWLRDQVIKSYGMTVTSAADHRKVTRSVLSRILNDNARLASMMAIRFEKAFGISAATLLRMQLLHDLTTAKLKASSSMSVSRVPPPTELRRVWNLLSAH